MAAALAYDSSGAAAASEAFLVAGTFEGTAFLYAAPRAAPPAADDVAVARPPAFPHLPFALVRQLQQMTDPKADGVLCVVRCHRRPCRPPPSAAPPPPVRPSLRANGREGRHQQEGGGGWSAHSPPSPSPPLPPPRPLSSDAQALHDGLGVAVCGTNDGTMRVWDLMAEDDDAPPQRVPPAAEGGDGLAALAWRAPEGGGEEREAELLSVAEDGGVTRWAILRGAGGGDVSPERRQQLHAEAKLGGYGGVACGPGGAEVYCAMTEPMGILSLGVAAN